jgi:hypothetical protein
MAYGLRTSALIENGPVDEPAKAQAQGFAGTSWQRLSEASRLELIEQALRAANDRIDGYPLAL